MNDTGFSGLPYDAAAHIAAVRALLNGGLTSKELLARQSFRDLASAKRKQDQQAERKRLRLEYHRALMAVVAVPHPPTKGRRPQLTPEQVQEIDARISAGESQKVIAQEFGISQPAVSAIWNGRLYAWVPRHETAAA